MGAMGVLTAQSLLGIGATVAMSKKAAAGASGGNRAAVAARPAVPAAPTAVVGDVDGSRTQNPQMENERDKERQAALLRAQQAPEIFTSGLGAAGLAETGKKSLLGG